MLNEVVIGLDPHKVSNTIVVLERDETLLTRRRFVHDDDGLVAMFAAVAEFPKRVWAVEGANGMGRNDRATPRRAGETVVDVPAKLVDPGAGVFDRAWDQDRSPPTRSRSLGLRSIPSICDTCDLMVRTWR